MAGLELFNLISFCFLPFVWPWKLFVIFSISHSQECADALNEAIDNKEEGIMVKLADSVYRPNTRKGDTVYYIEKGRTIYFIYMVPVVMN